MRTLQSSRRPHGAGAARHGRFHTAEAAFLDARPSGLVIALACFFAAGSPPAAASPSFTVVMEGLDNPRGLTFGEDGALYVAEAGRGGSAPCPVLRGITFCAGHRRRDAALQRRAAAHRDRPPVLRATVNRCGRHRTTRRVRAWPRSLCPPWPGGDPMLTPTEIRAALDPDLGRLLRVPRHGPWTRVADIARYEERANPGGGPSTAIRMACWLVRADTSSRMPGGTRCCACRTGAKSRR